MRRGPIGPQLVQQSLQRGQGPALDPLQLLRPVVDFPVQVIAAVIQGIQVHPGDVHRVDRGKLLRHALAHPPDSVGAHVGFLGRLHLVDGPRHAFHHEERSAQDVARILQPQCAWYTHRRAFQRPQNPELLCQIIGFEQRRRPGSQPHHDVAARLTTTLTRGDRQHHHFRRVAELHAIETLDPQAVGIGHLRAQPPGEAVAYLLEITAVRHDFSFPLAGPRSTAFRSCLNFDMSIGRQFGYRG